jgi:hypothetical protein
MVKTEFYLKIVGTSKLLVNLSKLYVDNGTSTKSLDLYRVQRVAKQSKQLHNGFFLKVLLDI